MAKVKFVKGGAQSQFLNLLGVPYGFLFIGPIGKTAPIMSFDLERLKLMLHECRKQGLFTKDQVQALEKAAEKAGLESMETMYNKVRQFQFPDDYLPLLHFKVCACFQPIAHGHIYDNDNNLVLSDINTLRIGFDFCERVAILLDGADKLSAVKLFQQMLAADLATNEDDWDKRYQALPEETRHKFEEDQKNKQRTVNPYWNLG